MDLAINTGDGERRTTIYERGLAKRGPSPGPGGWEGMIPLSRQLLVIPSLTKPLSVAEIRDIKKTASAWGRENVFPMIQKLTVCPI